jgi:hypothetical protein
MKQVLLSLLVIAVIFSSCTKTPSAPTTRDVQLRTGKWRITSSSVTLKLFNGKPGTVNYGQYRMPCLLDNFLKFDSLNRGAIHNGGVSCSKSDADSIAFIWVLKNNGNNIDLLNCYTLIDSVDQTIVFDPGPSIYEAQYATSSCYVSNLYNAQISNFSQSSFVLKYDLPAHYLDTTVAKGGSPTTPVVLLDTFHFAITYGNL